MRMNTTGIDFFGTNRVLITNSHPKTVSKFEF